jgi:hypothetical protein
MADYRKIVSIIKSKNKGFSWSLGASEPPCDLGTIDTKGIFGIKKNNTSYGVTWDDFKLNANSLGYEASCDNFKNMPDTIYNVIFKKVYWDSIQGDKIKNQGIANALVENRGLGIAFIFDKLKKLGYVRNLKNYQTSSNDLLGNSFRLTDTDIDFINKLEVEGQSNLLFDELKTEKDSVYLASKLSVLKTSEKIAIGVGVLFLLYVGYKLVKR